MTFEVADTPSIVAMMIVGLIMLGGAWALGEDFLKIPYPTFGRALGSFLLMGALVLLGLFLLIAGFLMLVGVQ